MQDPIELAGQRILPGDVRRVSIPVARLVTQAELALPVTVVHGRRDGPRLWISAAIHGDEVNGTEIIRRVLERVRPERLRGTLVAVPVVNVFGFVEQSRYLPDRRDLNRSFPGSRGGSLASRLAHLFITEVVDRCTHGLDLHTAAHRRTNLPQIRANLDDARVRQCALAFGAPIAVHSRGIPGSLRHAAQQRGIPAVVYEAGEPLRFDRRAIAVGTTGALRLLKHLGMLRAPRRDHAARSLEVRRTRWVRASRSGIVDLRVDLGDRVEKGDAVAVVRDTSGATISLVRATGSGLVIGLSTSPLLNRGEAVLHLAEVA